LNNEKPQMSTEKTASYKLKVTSSKFVTFNFQLSTFNWKHWLPLGVIFLVVFLAHALSRVVASTDSMWSVPTAVSILREGNTDLDEYAEMIEANDHYAVERFNGRYYPYFPIGVSLVAVPFVLVIDPVMKLAFNWFPGLPEYIKTRASLNHRAPPATIDIIYLHARVEAIIASLIVALTTVFIYLIAAGFLDRKYSLLIAFVFAFCTSAWSTASRGLWQHGPTMLMFSIALYLFLRARARPSIVQFAGLPLAFSYVIRPTNSISIALFTLLVLVRHRKYVLPYLGWALLVVLPFLWYNWSIYHSLLAPYYLQRLVTGSRFLEALAGNVVSPARGLLVFSPVLLFSFVGIFHKLRGRAWTALDTTLLAAIVLHWVVVSSWRGWVAGQSFGPRLFSDVLPYFAYFLIPVPSWLAGAKRLVRSAGYAVLAGLILISFGINYRGANSWATDAWNYVPSGISEDSPRLWDWHDLQFLRR
jgi:hypothetical protein